MRSVFTEVINGDTKLSRTEQLGLSTAQRRLIEMRKQLARAEQDYNDILSELGLKPDVKYSVDKDGFITESDGMPSPAYSA